MNRDRGKFRTFILAALNHFLSDQRDRARAAKRGGGKSIISLDAQTAEQRYQLEPIDTMTPEKLFDRLWAFTLLEKASSGLAEEYAADGKTELYNHLRSLEPGDGDALPHAEIGRRLGKSEKAITSEAWRFRKRYRELVRAEIAQTVTSPVEIDEEVRHLVAGVAW